MRSRAIWLAFAIGVTAGVAVALLYAPQNGTRTRRKLRQGFDDAGDYLKAQADRLTTAAMKHGSSAIKQSKDQVDSAVNSAHGVVASLVESAHSLV